MRARSELTSITEFLLITKRAPTSRVSFETSIGRNWLRILRWPRNLPSRPHPRNPGRKVPRRHRPRQILRGLPASPPMKTKRLFAYSIVLALLVLLFYFQFRTWRAFDWERFESQTGQAFRGWGLVHVLLGVAFTYFAYLMRAIRWKIFLRPVKRTTTKELIAPTIIGFTGISLLGRLGEMIRPYLIARKVQLPFSSQLAVWTVERIFDFGGFALLLISAIFFAPDLKALKYYDRFRQGGLLLIVFVAVLATVMWIINAKGEFVASLVQGAELTGFRHKLAA